MAAAALAVGALLLGTALWYLGPGSTRVTNQTSRQASTPGSTSPTGGNETRPALQQTAADFARCTFYYEKAEYDTAIAVCEEGLKLDPSNADLQKLLNKAKNAKATESAPAAVSKTQLRESPGTPRLPSALVPAVVGKTAPPEATGPQAAVTEAEMRVQRGKVLEGNQDWDGAIAEYREAIRLKPDYPQAHAELGWALGEHAGDWDGAIKEEAEAIRLNPNLAVAHGYLASVLRRKGDRDGEIKELRETVRVNPNDAVVHHNLGWALEHSGDMRGALEEFREIIRLKPDDPDAHGHLGWMLGQTGDWDGEIKEEREAIRLKPDDPDAHSYLGWAPEHTGNLTSALQEFRRAYELDPDDSNRKSAYERLSKKLNQ